jgi:Protein of unknown function (DUF1499)
MDKFRDIFVRIVLALALLLPVYFLVAALGTKFGLLDWRVGFGLMTFRWGVLVLGGVLLLALIALALAFFTPPRRGLGSALIALMIPALGIGYGVYVRQQAQTIPPIHDITTDFMEPPGFSPEVQAARAAVPDVNSLDLAAKRTGDGASFMDLQRAAYPDIAHISTSVGQAQAYETALTLAREQNWTIGATDAGAGLIEAVAESFWYGFKDDIVIRVRADGSGARVDMRSVSRVGRSDLGANAARMAPFLIALRARLEAVDPGPAPAPEREGAAAPEPDSPPP